MSRRGEGWYWGRTLTQTLCLPPFCLLSVFVASSCSPDGLALPPRRTLPYAVGRMFCELIAGNAKLVNTASR